MHTNRLSTEPLPSSRKSTTRDGQRSDSDIQGNKADIDNILKPPWLHSLMDSANVTILPALAAFHHNSKEALSHLGRITRLTNDMADEAVELLSTKLAHASEAFCTNSSKLSQVLTLVDCSMEVHMPTLDLPFEQPENHVREKTHSTNDTKDTDVPEF